MNVKRSLCCLIAVACCLPILSVAAQDTTPLVPPLATLVDPVITLLPDQSTAVPDATIVPGGSDSTAVPGGSDATSEPVIEGVIGPDTMATDDASMMTTAEADMGTMENGVMMPSDTNARTIGDIIAFQADLNVPEFTMLRTALESTGLLETLMDENVNYVLFAPTDAAFAKLPKATVDMLMSDSQFLRLALLNHVASGNLFVDNMDMMATMEPDMMATEDMMMTMEPDMMADHCMMDDDMDMMMTMEPGMMATDDMDMMMTMEPGMMATDDMMMGTMEPAMMATDDMDMMMTMEPDMMNMPQEIPSLGGLTLVIKTYEDCITVNDIPLGTRITASNGRIYIIDSVLTGDMDDMMMATMEPGMMATDDMDMMATMEPDMMATDDMMMSTMEPDMMATMEATQAP